MSARAAENIRTMPPADSLSRKRRMMETGRTGFGLGVIDFFSGYFRSVYIVEHEITIRYAQSWPLGTPVCYVARSEMFVQ
ncbi:hypothetical protein FQZ97_780330 [compost metagenome]